jgi:hypothetical protein
MSEAAAKPKYTLKDLKKAPPVARPGRLLPLNVPEDYANLQYMDAEEKELCGIQLLSRLEKFDNQATITVATAAHDPKAARIRSAFGGALMALAAPTYETRHLVGGTLLNLLVLTVVKWAKDETLVGGISRGVQEHYLEGFKPHHLQLMDFPESEVWNDDQRLMLKFAKAVLDNTMTDDLWKQAVDAWNPKMCVRYIHVINFFLGASIMNRTLGVTYPMSTETGQGGGRVAGVESQINKERAEYLKRVHG